MVRLGTAATEELDHPLVTRYIEENASRPTQEWIAVDTDEMTFRIERLPLREEIQSEANEQLVVELYSK